MSDKKRKLDSSSEKLVEDFDQAWNERDAEALAALFTEDADFQFYYGHMVRGRKRIKSYYQDKVFPFLPENMRHLTHSYKTRQLGEGILISDGKVDLILVDENGEQIEVKRRIRVTTVTIEDKDQLKFAAVRIMIPVKG